MTDENVLIVQADSGRNLAGERPPGGDGAGAAVVVQAACARTRSRATPPRPSANFRCAEIYFRNDRLVLPKTQLPARPINEHDGWCDDPRAPTATTGWSTSPTEWSHEKMWREDGLYDLVVVVGYNDDPPEGEWGSAIFLHIAREDYSRDPGLRRLRPRRSPGAAAAAHPATRGCACWLPAARRSPRKRRRSDDSPRAVVRGSEGLDSASSPARSFDVRTG